VHIAGPTAGAERDDKQRFKKRTIVEQLNGRLKDEFGGRIIYFRGAARS